MTSDQPAAAPRERIATLDIIRGVAVMGILAMNIVAFAMPDSAYLNPAAYGGATGINLATWVFNFVLIDGKMRGLFSFLFGASMLLVIDQAQAKGENPARVHFSRMFWLLLFGMAHLYFIWWGDILHHYALVGAVAYLFRNAPPPKLLAAACVLILMQVIMTANPPFTAYALELAMRAPHPSATTLSTYQSFQDAFGIMPPDGLAHDIAAHRGSYAAVFADRLPGANQAPVNTLVFVGMETLAYMLLGMAALRSGMLTGAWPRRRYRRWVAIGFGIGIPVQVALAAIMALNGFSLFIVTLCGVMLPTLVRPLMIAAWASLIVLTVQPGSAIAARIGAAGRMAFSNYLFTSLICTTLFYGYGFGLYGRLSRADLYLVVVAIWALMLLWSKPWLAHFRYGPLEWLWRSLARLRPQPMRGGALADVQPSCE
jgi:uncharacterized protein